MRDDPSVTTYDEPAATQALEVGDLPARGAAPWWKSKRLAVAALLAVAAVAEVAWYAAAADPLAERRAMLAVLSETEKAALAARFDRFQKLEPAEQDRLRKLHAAIEADADPEALRRTLARYQTWLASLPPQLSAQLVGLKTNERADMVASIVGEQRAAAAKTFGDADSKALIAWLEKMVREQRNKLVDTLPPAMRERLEHMGERERTWALMLFVLGTRGPDGPKLGNLTPQAFAELKEQLSPQAQRQWDAARGPDELKQLIVGWIRQSMERAAMSREAGMLSAQVSEQELRRFFEQELTDAERSRFVALPREEMMLQVRREYLRRKGVWRDFPWRPEGEGFGPARAFGGRQGPMKGFVPGAMGPGAGRPDDEGSDGPRPQGSPPFFNRPQNEGERRPERRPNLKTGDVTATSAEAND